MHYATLVARQELGGGNAPRNLLGLSGPVLPCVVGRESCRCDIGPRVGGGMSLERIRLVGIHACLLLARVYQASLRAWHGNGSHNHNRAANVLKLIVCSRASCRRYVILAGLVCIDAAHVCRGCLVSGRRLGILAFHKALYRHRGGNRFSHLYGGTLECSGKLCRSYAPAYGLVCGGAVGPYIFVWIG